MSFIDRPAIGSFLAVVTAEELQFALTVAMAAASGRTPRKSFRAKHQEAKDSGELHSGRNYLVLTDDPMNHAAFAIMDAFPDKTPEGDKKRRALLHRALFAMLEVMDDPRSTPYRREGEVSLILVEAVAVTPMLEGTEIPLDDIFQQAQNLVITKSMATR